MVDMPDNPRLIMNALEMLCNTDFRIDLSYGRNLGCRRFVTLGTFSTSGKSSGQMMHGFSITVVVCFNLETEE